MNDFNVEVFTKDCICDKCFKNCIEKNTCVNNVSTTIELQNNYILNVVNITNTYFTVLIQNGVETIVRNIYTNFDTQICLVDKCIKHLIIISGCIHTNSR